MTNPNDPWGQHPEDSPTERLGSPGVESTKPYGGNSFDEWGQPSNPTQALPPHDAQWGAYESGYPAAQPPQQPPPPGYGQGYQGGPPPGYPQGGDHGEPPRRNTGLWIALGLGVLALIAVGGVLAGLMLTGGKSDDGTTAAAPPSTQLLVPPTFQQTTPVTPPGGGGLPSLPGLGGEDLGATMGSITANTGTEITMSTLGGSTVRVLIDDATQVISLTSTKASELPVGDMVMVQGDKNPDGSIHAEIIISTALPSGPR